MTGAGQFDGLFIDHRDAAGTAMAWQHRGFGPDHDLFENRCGMGDGRDGQQAGRNHPHRTQCTVHVPHDRYQHGAWSRYDLPKLSSYLRNSARPTTR